MTKFLKLHKTKILFSQDLYPEIINTIEEFNNKFQSEEIFNVSKQFTNTITKYVNIKR